MVSIIVDSGSGVYAEASTQLIYEGDQAVVDGVEEDLDRLDVHFATDVEIVLLIHDGIAQRLVVTLALLPDEGQALTCRQSVRSMN